MPKFLEAIDETYTVSCPSLDDLSTSAASETSVAQVEGLRLTAMFPIYQNAMSNSSITVLQEVNVGSYPTVGAKDDFLQLLMQEENKTESRGVGAWRPSLRYQTPTFSALSTYDTLSSSLDFRSVKILTSSLLGSFSFRTHGATKYAQLLRTILVKNSSSEKKFSCGALYNQASQIFEQNQDIIQGAVEFSNKNRSITLRVTQHDAAVLTAGYATRLSRYLTAGVDTNLFCANYAMVTNVGAAASINKWNVFGLLNRSPDFSKAATEGLNSFVYSVDTSISKRMSDRLLLAAKLTSQLCRKPDVQFKVGFEALFPDARVSGHVNKNLSVEVAMQRTDNTLFTSMLDFKNKNFKFGMSYEFTGAL